MQYCSSSSVESTHQLDVALHVQHQVLRLQVSVHDVLLVEVGVGLHHAGGAEHGGGLVKTSPEQKDRRELLEATNIYTRVMML